MPFGDQTAAEGIYETPRLACIHISKRQQLGCTTAKAATSAAAGATGMRQAMLWCTGRPTEWSYSFLKTLLSTRVLRKRAEQLGIARLTGHGDGRSSVWWDNG